MKEFLETNKKTLIICFVLICVGLVITFFLENDYLFEDNVYIEEENYLKNYEVNEIIPINMTVQQVARKYLAEYTKLIFDNPELAYSLVDEEYKESKFTSLEDFKSFFAKQVDSKFFNAKIEKISVKNKFNYKEIYIVDSSNNTYIFKEYSIMQYKVLFDNYTI